MKKAYTLSEKLLKDINDYTTKHVSVDGKNIYSEDSLFDLQIIIEGGATLHKYLVEKKLFDKMGSTVLSALLGLQKHLEQLEITKDNAEKLRLSNVLQIWDQTKITIAVLANAILDYRDENKESI